MSDSAVLETASEPSARRTRSDSEIQEMLASAVKLYAQRASECDGALPAFAPGTQITATEAMVTISAILKAVNLQIFELGMWQAWSGR
jgi:hypothetical protein